MNFTRLRASGGTALCAGCRLLPWVIGVAMPFVAGWYAWRYTPLAPIADHWSIAAPYILHQAEGTLGWAEFNEQSNDSRMIVPRLVETGLGALTKWDFRAETAAIVVMASLISLCVLFMLRRSFAERPGIVPWMWAASSLLLFHPLQSMNWVFGVLVAYFLLVLFVAAMAAAFMTRWALGLKFGAGVLCAIGAAYCFLCGFLAWGVLVVLLAGELWGARRRWTVWLGAFALLGALAALSMAVYFHGYEWRSGTHFGGLLALRPLDVAVFALTWLGSAFCQMVSLVTDAHTGWDKTGGLAFGAAGVAGAVWLVVAGWKARPLTRAFWRVATPWLGLVLFALGNGALITVGRLEIGSDPALYPRYVIFSIWFWIGLLAVGGVAVQEGWLRVPMRSLAAVAFVFLLAYLGGWRWGVREMERHAYSTRPLHAALQFSNVAWQEDMLNLLSWGDLQAVRKIAPRLSELGYLRPPLLDSALVQDMRREDWRGDKTGETVHRGEVESVAWMEGALCIKGWAVRVKDREPAHAVVLTIEAPGQPERILCVAQKMTRRGLAQKYKVRVYGGRVGWEAHLSAGQSSQAQAGVVRCYAYDIYRQILEPLRVSEDAGEILRVPERKDKGEAGHG